MLSQPVLGRDGASVVDEEERRNSRAARHGHGRAPYTMTWDGDDVDTLAQERPGPQKRRRLSASSSSPPASSPPAPRARLTKTRTMPAAALAATSPFSLELGTGLVYDDRMLLHDIPGPIAHPEAPERVSAIYRLLKRSGCAARMRRIGVREATREEVLRVHDEGVWEGVQRSELFPALELARRTPLLEAVSSLYLNEWSAECTRLACGGTIELCDAVASGRIRNGFAVVRPPGHHAEPHHSMGFCFYNNVAVAVKTLRARYPPGHRHAVRRVLILDWDVHHGNGTQRAFWDDPDTLYISIHRYEDGEYYPGGTYGANETVGPRGHAAEGTTVNIGWPTIGMGDADYLHAFREVVMPIAHEFAPDMVIVSAGFDAAEGDEYGECNVTPRGYAHMTHMLSSLAKGRLAVVLEGGYNIQASAAAALAVTKIILGDEPPVVGKGVAGMVACDTVRDVQRIQSQFWQCMRLSPLGVPPEVDAFTDLVGVGGGSGAGEGARPKAMAETMPMVNGTKPRKATQTPLLTPLYKVATAWRTAHLQQKFNLTRLPIPTSIAGFLDEPIPDEDQDADDDDDVSLPKHPLHPPLPKTRTRSGAEGSVHISHDLFERGYRTIVMLVHDAGTVRTDPAPGLAMLGPDLRAVDEEEYDEEEEEEEDEDDEDEDEDEDDEYQDEEDGAGLDKPRRVVPLPVDAVPMPNGDLAQGHEALAHEDVDGEDGTASGGPLSLKSSRAYERALAHLRSSQEDWSSYLIDPTEALLSWAAHEAGHGIVDVALPTHISMALRSGRQRDDPVHGPVDAKLSRRGAAYLSRLAERVDALLMHVWDHCVRVCPRTGAGAGPDVVLIGHGPGCDAVVRLLANRALHLSEELVRAEQEEYGRVLALPIVRAVVQVYGFEDLALAAAEPREQVVGGGGAGRPTDVHNSHKMRAQLASTATTSPNPHAALAVSLPVEQDEEEDEEHFDDIRGATTMAQYASRPGGVGLTVAAERLGLTTAPESAVETLKEQGPYINPGALPTTPGRSAGVHAGADASHAATRSPWNSPNGTSVHFRLLDSHRVGLALGDGEAGDDGDNDVAALWASMCGGPELRAWYGAHSKVILPRDHPYHKWKMESKVRRAAGDISKRATENDPLKLVSYALPGIAAFIERRVAAEPGH